MSLRCEDAGAWHVPERIWTINVVYWMIFCLGRWSKGSHECVTIDMSMSTLSGWEPCGTCLMGLADPIM